MTTGGIIASTVSGVKSADLGCLEEPSSGPPYMQMQAGTPAAVLEYGSARKRSRQLTPSND